MGAAAVLRRNLLIYGARRDHRARSSASSSSTSSSRRWGSKLMRRQLLPGAHDLRRLHRARRARLPARRDRHRAGRVPDRADGSLVEARREGRRLVAHRPDVHEAREYFQPRPSAAGDGYDADWRAAASNLGPSNPDLLDDRSQERVEAYREANGLAADATVPVDAVTASGSGLDPHISVANARLRRRASPRRAASRSRRCSQLVDEQHRRPLARLPRRAGRQRARAQPRARRAAA